MSNPQLRPARFAGSWYPDDAQALEALLADALPESETAPAKAVVAPHAGYRYSLRIAAAAYARVRIPQRVVVLCPNHSVPPPVLSLWPGGEWGDPPGAVPRSTPACASVSWRRSRA